MSSGDSWVTARPDRPTFVVWLLITIGINVLALIVVDWLFDGVLVGRWAPILVAALVLGLGNAFLKPILAILTLPLILVTFGLGYFALNIAMLGLAEWVSSEFTIDGFWTYVGAAIVVWFVNVVMQALLGAVSGTNVRRPARRS
jgi:putative membrane protein